MERNAQPEGLDRIRFPETVADAADGLREGITASVPPNCAERCRVSCGCAGCRLSTTLVLGSEVVAPDMFEDLGA